jgi:cobalt-zinc-cadmium efflux system outer membrane protein
VPLPLWNQHTADINSARYAAEQAEVMLLAAEQKAEIDVRTAFTRYQLAQERVSRFQSGTLAGADKVLAAKRFSYQRGQTTLLDLLAAQRSANEVYLDYYDALSDAAKALIELERSSQMWDVSF